MSPKKWSKNTFGWARAEVLGALVNAVFLVALCFSITVEACKRFIEIEPIHDPQLLLAVGGLGLLVNLIGLLLFHSEDLCNICYRLQRFSIKNVLIISVCTVVLWNCNFCLTLLRVILLCSSFKDELCDLIEACRRYLEHGGHEHSHGGLTRSRNRLTQLAVTDDNENDETYPSPPPIPQPDSHGHSHSADSGQMNMRGVFLHVLSDALGSVIVVISALIFWLTEWRYRYYIDPALSIVLVALILHSVWPLLRDSALILLQTVPTHIQVDAIQRRLLAKVDGVLAVHEFHVWQLAGDRIIASAHIRYVHVVARGRRNCTVYVLGVGICRST